MSLFHKISLAAMFIMAAFASGYWQGRQHGYEATLKAAISAYQSREKINDKVQNMDAAALCLALGGLPVECADIMRVLDKAL